MYAAVVDADGFVASTHTGNVEVEPPNKRLIIEEDEYNRINDIWARSLRAKLANGRITEERHLTAVKKAVKHVDVKAAIDAAYSKVAAEVHKVRTRRVKGSKRFFTLHGADEGRQLDLGILLATGKKKPTDEIVITNRNTFRKKKITVQEWLDGLAEYYEMKTELRDLQLTYENKIGAIYHDKNRSDEKKVADLNALEIPPCLGLEEFDSLDDIKKAHALAGGSK